MDEPNAEDRRLVLLVDDDVESRRHTRRLLELHGLEVVQASNAIAALELIQRLPESFRLVITELDLPGLPGSVMAEILRLFRPDLPALCMSGRVVAGVVKGRRCLAKPLQGAELLEALEDQRAFGEWEAIPEEWAVRARARYAAVGDLVEAAFELARVAGSES